MGLYIGVDVGGTKVVAAEVRPDNALGMVARRATPGRRVPVSLVEDAITEAVLEVADARPIAGVGLAAAGFVDRAGERVMFAPHLPWVDDPVRARLEQRWGCPVAMDNDAHCAALAELTGGAAVGVDQALLITLGTGIGGAVVVGGRLVRGANGMAGEFGHMQVKPGGRACQCGRSGCWEQYCSGNALVRRLEKQQLTGPAITEAALAGDPHARSALEKTGHWLGVGLANLVAAFDPALVVIGGGVSAAGDLLLDPARAELEASLVGAGHRVVPPVVRARFGPEAGVVGAAHLVRATR